MEEIVAEITLQARSSPDVNQTSGVSVRMSIANYETLAANALRRALRLGEREAVPRISDLDALVQATAGKLELEYAGEAQERRRRGARADARGPRAWSSTGQVPVEGVASVVEAFDQGWVVEVSADLASAEYLDGLDEIRGLREAAARLAGGDTPGAAGLGHRVPARGPPPLQPPQQDQPRGRRPLRARMKLHRYSRWDGTQQEFSLDAKRALDALSDLLMEGLYVDEALEWMRQYGFELGGLDMRVMGLEELIEELRQEIRELEQRYHLDRATDELARRLEEILDREERALREAHGLESARLNDFLARRHGERAASPSDRALRDHAFEDEEAGADFRELLEELERLRALEEFREGPRRALPGPRGRRLRDRPADPRARRGARAAGAATSPRGTSSRSRRRRCGSCCRRARCAR